MKAFETLMQVDQEIAETLKLELPEFSRTLFGLTKAYVDNIKAHDSDGDRWFIKGRFQYILERFVGHERETGDRRSFRYVIDQAIRIAEMRYQVVAESIELAVQPDTLDFVLKLPEKVRARIGPPAMGLPNMEELAERMLNDVVDTTVPVKEDRTATGLVRVSSR